MIIIKNILYFIQIRHTDDLHSTGTRLVLISLNDHLLEVLNIKQIREGGRFE